MSMKIIVPASTANLGPGFDSIGMALSLYVTVTIGKSQKEWHVIHPFGEEVPTNESNLIVETALHVCPTLQPHELVVESDIPLTRGLGSSGSAIVAGIELANSLGNLHLTKEEKVQLAAKIEGHPDNVAPSILGGIVVGVTLNEKTSYCTIGIPDFEIIALIPEEELKTSLSRSVLPKQLNYKDAITGSAISNVLVASLITNNMQQLAEVLELDVFHEPYRKPLLTNFDEIRTVVKEAGGIGVVLSGAGPTLLAFVHPSTHHYVLTQLQQFSGSYKIISLAVDKVGLSVVEGIFE